MTTEDDLIRALIEENSVDLYDPSWQITAMDFSVKTGKSYKVAKAVLEKQVTVGKMKKKPVQISSGNIATAYYDSKLDIKT